MAPTLLKVLQEEALEAGEIHATEVAVEVKIVHVEGIRIDPLFLAAAAATTTAAAAATNAHDG